MALIHSKSFKIRFRNQMWKMVDIILNFRRIMEISLQFLKERKKKQNLTNCILIHFTK